MNKKTSRKHVKPNEFEHRFVGTFDDEPDAWEFALGEGVADRVLGYDGAKPLPLMSSIMGLGGWVVDRYEMYEDGTLTVFARCQIMPVACGCGKSDLILHGTQIQKFRDLPYHMRPTTLIVQRQRLRCKTCGKTQFQEMPHMHGRFMMTERLVEYIEVQSMKRTFASIASDVGADEKTVRTIFTAYAKELERRHKVYTPEWLGIDEVHLTHQMRCVLTDVYQRKPLDILKDRNKPTVAKWLREHMDASKLKVVTIDMHTGYLNAVQDVLPNVKIIVDKFHVQRAANVALELVRKATHKSLTDYQRKQLKHDRKIMLMRRSELEAKEQFILQTWLLNFDDLGKAYMLKEAFFDLYSFSTKLEAQTAYQTWLDELGTQSEVVQEAFSSLVTSMSNWGEYIFNYFDHRATNAYTESLNGMLKQIYRNGRSYSFPAIRAKVLYGKIDHQR
jgi:transposase